MAILRTLRICDLAIIDEFTVEFGPGLNLLTGETGAGKSIVIDALSLVAGARADRGCVRSGAERAVVEALFEIDDDAASRAWAETVGLDALEDGELVVRREVLAEGSGRIRVNGSPCTVQMLRELAGGLIELHGQRDQQGLLVAARQLELLDRFAGNDARLDRVGSAFAAVREAGEALSRLGEMERDRVERVDRLRRMIEAIEVLDPRPGELDELGRQRQVLRNAERMVELLDRAVSLGHDDDPAAAGLAAAVAARAEELAGLDPSLEDVARRLREAAVEIQDAVCALRDYRDGTDFDPRRLDQLEGRSAALERLCLEHGVDESGLVGRLAGAREELGGLEDLGAATEKARKDEGLALESYAAAAAALTRARRSAAGRLKPALEQQLSKLALERAAVSVELIGIRTTEDQAARAGPPLGARGAERAEFLLAANPGEAARPLADIASGGELSRVMLALHVVAGATRDGRVMVFDEVDTGIGGAVADAVGSRLSALAKQHQLLCVTHLPQVAAHADRHFRVSKRIESGRTRVTIEVLGGQHRVDELARMLGGRQATAASRRHAGELLTAAGRGERRARS